MSLTVQHHDVVPAHGSAFSRELKTLINQYARENGSDTPDMILADYMAECLDAFDRAVTRRKAWYHDQAQIVHGIDAPRS